MRKKTVIILLLIVFALALVGCSSDKVPSDLYITVHDETDVPAGEYTLKYTINKFGEYEKQYNLHVSAYVYDESNTPLTVKNNRTVTLESDKKYDVEVVLYGIVNDEQFLLSEHYSIETKHVDRVVVFLDNDNKTLFGPYLVPYGGNFSDLYEMPDVPDIIVEENNLDTSIESKQWVVVIDNKDVPLLPEHLQNIIYNVYVYPSIEYTRKASEHTITFVSNGGTEVDVYHGNASLIPQKPATPERDGYAFMGWCLDEECTEYYLWSANDTLTEDLTLYAKWVKNLDNATADKHFLYELRTDAYGNEFYRISAYEASNLYGELVLPNNHNGLPVREIAENGFKDAHITSVYIPDPYELSIQRAFFNCTELTKVTFAPELQLLSIGASTFSGCIALEDIVLPDTVKRITSKAFFNCISLTAIDLPDSLLYINDYAFYGCANLQSILIPAETQYIMESAFENCTSLSEFLLEENTKIYSIEEKVLRGTNVTEVFLPTRMQEKEPFADTPEITVTYY